MGLMSGPPRRCKVRQRGGQACVGVCECVFGFRFVLAFLGVGLLFGGVHAARIMPDDRQE